MSFSPSWRSPTSLPSPLPRCLAKPCRIATLLHHHRHHVVMLLELIYYFATLAGSRSRGRHRAERVLNTEVTYVRYLDRSDCEDVRLHQPRCGSPGLGGLRTAGLYPLAGLLDYEDTRLKSPSRVWKGLSLAWKENLAIRIYRSPTIVTDFV